MMNHLPVCLYGALSATQRTTHEYTDGLLFHHNPDGVVRPPSQYVPEC